jgi:nucleoid DNA-binding protein
MNATELVAKLGEAHGVSKAQAKAIVDDFLKDIVDAAASGAEVAAAGVREVQSQGDAGARRPQSGKWREDQDRVVKGVYLLVRQIGQGPTERLTRTTAEAVSD